MSRYSPESDGGSPSARHASLSAELRIASTNLQQSLDALGNMTSWESSASPRRNGHTGAASPSPVFRSSPDRDNLLLDRIQELEGSQSRYQKEHATLRSELAVKEEKLRRLAAAHRRLKTREGGDGVDGSYGVAPTARQAQSMEARKRAAEAALKKANAEKKDLAKENRQLRQQIAAASSDEGGWDGEEGMMTPARRHHEARLEEEVAARRKAEAMLAEANTATPGSRKAAKLLQNERDLLKQQLDVLSSPGGAVPGRGGEKKILLSARTRDKLQLEEQRMEQTIALIREGQAEAVQAAEEQRNVEAQARQRAESQSAEADALAAKLAEALSSLRSHCEELEQKVESQLRVEDLKSSTRAGFLEEQQQRVDALRQSEAESRAVADTSMSDLVVQAVAHASQRFDGVIDEMIGTELDQTVGDAAAQVKEARAEVRAQFEERVSTLERQLSEAQSKSEEQQRIVSQQERDSQVAEQTLAEYEKRAEKRLEEVRAPSPPPPPAQARWSRGRGGEARGGLGAGCAHSKCGGGASQVISNGRLHAQQVADQAREESERGWADLVEVLQTQAQTAQEDSVTAKRQAALAEQKITALELRQQTLEQERSAATQKAAAAAGHDGAEQSLNQLRSELYSAEARASQIERDMQAAVAKAGLDAEQKTLEDVEELIQKLESDNRTLRQQLEDARQTAKRSLADDESREWLEEIEQLAHTEAELRAKAEAESKQLRAQLRESAHTAPMAAADSSEQLSTLQSRVSELAQQLQEERAKRTAQLAQQPAGEGDMLGELSETLAAERALRLQAEAQADGSEEQRIQAQQRVEELQMEVESLQLEVDVAALGSSPTASSSAVAPEPEPESAAMEGVPPVASRLQITVPPPAPSSLVLDQMSPTHSQLSMSMDTITAIYQRADVNGDGNVSRAELVESVRRDPALQNLFNLPVGKRLGEEERLRIEGIFDDVDSDGSFGISLDEFAGYVNRKYASLPVLPPGSYQLGQRADRVISVALDLSVTLTDPRERDEERRVVFLDAAPASSARRIPGNVSARSSSSASSRTDATRERASVRRGGAFTYDPAVSTDPTTAEIADLIGVAEVGMQSMVDQDFLGRRHRFRQSMKQKIAQELRTHAKAPHELDLPSYCVRPRLSEPYEGLLHAFSIGLIFPDGNTASIDCDPDMKMSDLLELAYAEAEGDGGEEDVPEWLPRTTMNESDALSMSLILKARGIHDYLDGDDTLLNYKYIRDKMRDELTPELVVILRSDAIEECMQSQRSVVQLDQTTSLVEDSDSDDEDNFEKLERQFDPRADKATWEFIPVTELRQRMRVCICGVDSLVYPDGKVDEWVDPASIMGAFAIPKKKTRRASLASLGGGSKKGGDSSDEEAHGHGKKSKAKDQVDVGADVVFVEAGLYYGGRLLHDIPVTTSKQPRSAHPRYSEWLNFEFDACHLPRSTRLCFTVYKCGDQEEGDCKGTPLGWVGMYLFDDRGRMEQGQQTFRLWPSDHANPIGTCEQNLRSDEGSDAATLTIKLAEYPKPVLHPRMRTTSTRHATAPSLPAQPWTVTDRERVQKLLQADPLEEFSKEDRALVWKLRHLCSTRSGGLAKVLYSVDWTDTVAVHEVYRLLDEWEPLSPQHALELLDSRFPDQRVRSYAVECLKPLRDDELGLCILQLVQVLKYEQSHDSQLACFLLTRSLRCPNYIGHTFFWYLKGEMHVPEIAERYGVLLELYLELVPAHRADLIKQNDVMHKLTYAARSIKRSSVNKKDRLMVLHSVLAETEFPETFGLPLNPEWVCKNLKFEKCKYMDSKKLPLWLVFENADPHGKDLYVIFKDGDDLRQDMLTLQMFRIMDNIWRRSNLNLGMIPYGCISTGDEIGFIEVQIASQFHVMRSIGTHCKSSSSLLATGCDGLGHHSKYHV
jgi:hypothetical protein